MAVEALEDRRLLSVVQQAADFGINDSSDPVPLAEFNGEMYFAADDGVLGRELWKVDASGNVSLAADIATGAASSDPLTMVADENVAYIVANDGLHGHELWKLDSSGNVALVADICVGGIGSLPQDLVLSGDGTLFFTATDSAHGREVWSVDNSGNASLVADINPGSNSSYAEYLTPFNGGLYFGADSSYDPPEVTDPDYGETSPSRRLWHVDSSGNVTAASSYHVWEIVTFSGDLYFRGYESTVGSGLWRIDLPGTAPENLSSSFISGLSVAGDHLYFAAGAGLYRIDTSGIISERLANVQFLESFGEFVVFNGDVYFDAELEDPVPEDGYYPGWNFYRYDGGLTEVMSGGVSDVVSLPTGLYFTAYTTEGNNIHKIDTAGEISVVVDQESSSLMEYNGDVYFQSVDDGHGNELWKLDSLGDYSLAADIKSGGSVYPDHLVVFDDQLYFEADDAVWRMNSTGDRSLATESRVAFLTVFDGNLYYQGAEPGYGYGLWQMTPSGVKTMIDDISTSPSHPYSVEAIVFEDALFYIAEKKVWRLGQDGSLNALADAYMSSYASHLAVLGDHLYFIGSDLALWRLDAAGNASLAADISLVPYTDLTVLGNEMYFKRGTGLYSELWKIDTEGNLNPADGVTPLGEIGGELYFSMDDGVHGEELWKYDADGNPVRLTDVNPAGSSNPTNLVAFDDDIYFTADDGSLGGAIWKLNATGSVSFAEDLMPGSLVEWAWHEPTEFNGELYFAASAGSDNRQLWKLSESERLGEVDFVELADVNVAEGAKAYTFTTTYGGYLSVAVRPRSLSTELLTLELLDSTGNPVGESSISPDGPRIDLAGVAAGETYTLGATGTMTSVDLVICNLVEVDGTAVTVHGSELGDEFGYEPGENHTLSVNEISYEFDPAEVSSVHFACGGGDDIVSIRGTEGNETASFRPVGGAMTTTATGFTVSVEDARSVSLHGGGGDDVVEVIDGEGDDFFSINPDYVEMFTQTDSPRLPRFEANQFGEIHTYARESGNDTVWFSGSAGADRVKVYPELVKLMNADCYTRAKFFENVKVDTATGADRAVVAASDGADVLWAMKNEMRIAQDVSLEEGQSPDFENMAYGVTILNCENLVARSRGGDDWVELHDSALNDVLIARPHKIEMMNAPRRADGVGRGEEYRITARGFRHMTAVADQGGDNDVAKLYDSSEDGVDTWNAAYVDGETWSTMTSPSRLLYEVFAFEQVGGYGFNGGLGENHGINRKEHADDVDFVFQWGYWEGSDEPVTTTPSRPRGRGEYAER